mmetsp:Transcript_72889/g.211006  ORF Transcript_72889/g.211006 Transcript_72889/m.211006 type:complete len:94 (-) Transcript_72889:1246-1527(-)
MTCFTRSWNPGMLPGLQAIEHGDHSVHEERSQLRSQLPVLHASGFTGESQNLPPFFGVVSTDRVIWRAPPPHSFVHLDHADQSDISQSTGHLN